MFKEEILEENQKNPSQESNQDDNMQNNISLAEFFSQNKDLLQSTEREFVRTIETQILQCRSGLMQLRGTGQLTNKKYKQKKIALRKQIARLESLLTNPCAAEKLIKKTQAYQENMESILKQAKEKENQKTESLDSNVSESKTTTE